MVVLVDLEENGLEPTYGQSNLGSITHHSTNGFIGQSSPLMYQPDERENPNLDSLFSASLSCYPVVSALASHLDLNSLHDLSLTCRQFRANLLQFRSQLIKQTLTCINEQVDLGPKLGDRFRESLQIWTGMGANGRRVQGSNSVRITSGRVGRCARDMVGGCRRCGVIVCRNCTIKAPPVETLEGRHRRLCRTCQKAPLDCHFSPQRELEPSEPHSMALAEIDPLAIRRASTPSTPTLTRTPKTITAPPSSHSTGYPAFTSPAFAREPCSCALMIYLCVSCGSAARTADVTYMRGWTWRTRYSTYLGGLGTGIGEGNEGVACGRGAQCLKFKEVEKEIDADASELAQLMIDEGEGHHWTGTSFFTQEIEGIGGVMKKKVKKVVRVGAVVKEYEDERDKGNFLGREKKGANRSWCAWCERVVPSTNDVEPTALGRDLDESPGSERGMRAMNPDDVYEA